MKTWDCDPNSRFDFVMVPNSGIGIDCREPNRFDTNNFINGDQPLIEITQIRTCNGSVVNW